MFLVFRELSSHRGEADAEKMCHCACTITTLDVVTSVGPFAGIGANRMQLQYHTCNFPKETLWHTEMSLILTEITLATNSVRNNENNDEEYQPSLLL